MNQRNQLFSMIIMNILIGLAAYELEREHERWWPEMIFVISNNYLMNILCLFTSDKALFDWLEFACILSAEEQTSESCCLQN